MQSYSEDLRSCWKYSTSVGTSNFTKIHLGQSFFMIGVENFFIYFPGRHALRTESHFQQYRQPRKLPARKRPGHLDRVFFKTSQIPLKKDVYHATSLRRLKHILDKISILWRLWYLSKISLESTYDTWKYLWYYPQEWFCLISKELLKYLIK